MKEYPVNTEKLKKIINTEIFDTKQGFKFMSDKCQCREVVIGRNIIYEFLRTRGFSFHMIAVLFNGRSVENDKKDHATIINGIKRYYEMMEYPGQYPEFIVLKNRLKPLLEDCLLSPEQQVQAYVMTTSERMLYNAESVTDFIQAKKYLVNQLNKSLQA